MKNVITGMGKNLRSYMRTNNMELSLARTEELIRLADTYLDDEEILEIRKNLPLLAEDARGSRQ